MNITSFLANKCLQFLIDTSYEEDEHPAVYLTHNAPAPPHKNTIFPQPPWAINTDDFKNTCNNCGVCITACENNILVQSEAGYPLVDFSRGFCSFCGECAKSCPEGALEYDPSSPPWDLNVIITSNCLSHNDILCRTCLEHCDEEAITISKTSNRPGKPVVQTDRCTGCGACVYACPGRAINVSGAE